MVVPKRPASHRPGPSWFASQEKALELRQKEPGSTFAVVVVDLEGVKEKHVDFCDHRAGVFNRVFD